jgi:hypothetical protein
LREKCNILNAMGGHIPFVHTVMIREPELKQKIKKAMKEVIHK